MRGSGARPPYLWRQFPWQRAAAGRGPSTGPATPLPRPRHPSPGWAPPSAAPAWPLSVSPFRPLPLPGPRAIGTRGQPAAAARLGDPAARPWLAVPRRYDCGLAGPRCDARRAGAPCCCRRRDSSRRLRCQHRRRRYRSGLLPPAARRSPAPAPPRPCPRSRPAPPRRGRRPRSSSRPAQPPPPRCSRACYYAGESGLPSPRLPRHTAAPGLQQAPIRDVPDPLEASSPLGKNQREDEQVEAAPSGSVTEQARRPRNS